MKLENLLTTCAAVSLLAAPAVADAATERDGLEACVRALAADLGDAQGAPVRYRIGDGSSTSLRRLARRTTFHIDARDAERSEIVARVDCIVDSRAGVKKLTILSLTARDAAKRSRF